MDSVILRKYELSNGRAADVVHLTYGRARICLVGVEDDLCYQDVW